MLNPCVAGFAIPQPLTQSFNFVDDGRLCFLLPRIDRRYGIGNSFQMVQSHSNVEPIEHRSGCDSGVDKKFLSPGQPSVNAVNFVSAARPTEVRLR